MLCYFLLLCVYFVMTSVSETVCHPQHVNPNSFKSKVTISLNEVDFGRVSLGQAIDFQNFLYTLQSFTTQSITDTNFEDIQLEFLNVAIYLYSYAC